ncbi:alpha/beta hydrolase [Persicobacter diffluens]
MTKKPQTPFVLRTIQWAFPKLEKISPGLAGKWYAKLFFTPFKYPVKERELSFLATATTHKLNYQKNSISLYEWKGDKQKTVLFVHGWMGRASQFNLLVEQFQAKGYRCIAFDAPGHGQSEGKETNVLEFAEIASYLDQRFGPFHLVVGHSLGGVAALIAQTRKALCKKLIMIGSPAVGEDILKGFQKKINASAKNDAYLHAYINARSDKNFFELAGKQLIAEVGEVELMLIHDQDDTEVPYYHLEEFKQRFPTAVTYSTKGLGHNRTLRTEEVIKKCLEFAEVQSEV